MKIIRLSFKDRESGWNIKDLYFNGLTLLVGASGVGKTQILHAISSLIRIGRGLSAGAVEWSFGFEVDNTQYRWDGAFSIEENSLSKTVDSRESTFPIEYEKLYRINGKKELLVERTPTDLVFNGKQTVKLEATKSAIALLKEEEDIMPVYDGLTHVYLLHPTMERRGIIPLFMKIAGMPPITNLDELRRYKSFTPIERLFLLYKNKIKTYNDIIDRFTNIFPFVETVKFTVETVMDKYQSPILKIKEKGVKTWVSQNRISSGMLRTLIHIIVITLAEKGDVILIDEFENGLGVNCIEEVADMIINPEQNLQFVITSHHPYVINSIDYKWWKIVTRKGSDVSVSTAEALHIGEHSKHDAFLQLVQSSAYKTGIL